MAAIGELLSDIVADYENVSSLSGAQLVKKCEKVRESLKTIVRLHLADEEMLKREIGKTKGKTSQTEMILNFFHHLVSQFPHPVFAPSSAQLQTLSCSERELAFAKYKDFLFWMFRSMFQLLSASSLQDIHSIIIKVLVAYIELIKTKNVSILAVLLEEVIQLCTELNQIHEDKLTGSGLSSGSSAEELVSFKTASKGQPGYLKLQLTNSVEILMKNCASLLKVFVPEVCQFAPMQLDKVWCVGLYQLEHGDFQLKADSLCLLGSMLHNHGLPEGKVLHYLLFCTVASMEMAVASIKDDNKCLKKESVWKAFLHELSQFMVEIFSTDVKNSENDKKEPNQMQTEEESNRKFEDVKHTIPDDYITTFCDFFANELSEMGDLDVKMYENEEVEFLKSVLVALVYLVHPSRLLSTTVAVQKRMGQIEKVFQWVLELGVLDNSIKFIVRSLLLEVENYSSFEIANRPGVPQFKILSCAIDFFKRLCGDVVKNCSTISTKDSVSRCINVISRLCHVLAFFAEFLVHSVQNSGSDIIKDKMLDHIVNEILDESLVKLLIKGFLDGLKEIISLKNAEFEALPFYGESIKLVQVFNVLLHLGAHCHAAESFSKKVDHFSKNLLLPFVALISIPWLEVVKLEDLSADLSNSGILQNTLVPISRGLKKLGLDISNPLTDAGKTVMCDCVKALALLQEPKYPRWRSTVLFKWSTSVDSTISNVALSFLPFFITKSLPATGAFKGILSHLKTLLKNISTDFSHSSLLAICILVHGIVQHLHGGCNLIVMSWMESSSKFCQSCAPIETNVLSFALKLEKQDSDCRNVVKTVKDDVLSLLGSITDSINSILKEKWVSTDAASLISSSDEKEGIGDMKKCSAHLQNCFLHFTAAFFALTEYKNPVVNNLDHLLRCWLENMKFFSGSNFEETFYYALDSRHDSSWNKQLCSAIDNILMTSHQNKDVKSRIHAIKFIGAILKACLEQEKGEFCCSELFVWALSHLFIQLSSSSSIVQSYSYLSLCALQSNDFLQKYSLEICSCVGKCLLREHPCSGSRAAIEIIEDAAHLFTKNPDEFLTQNMQQILPVIIASKQREKLLKLLSEITGQSRADILMPNFKFIFCHAVMERDDLSLLFQFLEKETRIEKTSLLRLNFGSLLHHLVTYVSLNAEQVRTALNVISDVKEDGKGSSDASLSELLQPHFLGILTFFNCQLRSSSVSAAEKKRIIESLTLLLKLMQSKEITLVRVKIMNTLCLAQQLFKHIIWYKVCCGAWNTFIQCVEPVCLGSLLSQVAVTLLPLLEILPNEVSDILTYLVIDKAVNTKENLSELYFLPKHSVLDKINKKVQLEINKQSKDDLATHLSQAIQLMMHESSEVRVHALTRLRQTLKEKQREVQQNHTLYGRDVTDIVMSQVVSTLLVGCRDNNKQIRLLCGQCLGLIGGIDPDRLVLSLPGTTTSFAEFFMIDDPNFAFHLISELVKAFLAAKSTHQDISAFAIQELLKIYDCKEGTKDTHGRRLWRRFSENVQEVLEPHHTSRYLLKKTDLPLSNSKQPVLFRKTNMTFRDWVGSFCSLLMQIVYESNESSTAGRVLRACSAVAKNDVNIALFLLPNTTLQALLVTDHMDFIVQEVLAVLEHTENLKDTALIESDSEASNMRSSSGVEQSSSQDNSMNLVNAQHARGSHLLQLSAQAIFSVLDHVTRWLRKAEIGSNDAKVKATSSARSGKTSSNIETAKEFLSKIPQLLLAQASFRCRAYRRALLHYEAHLRDKKNGSSSQSKEYSVDEQAIDFLQQLFVEMDEPDGVAGIAAVRLGKPTLNIQIKQLESTGKLQDACACYSHAIKMNPSDLPRTKDYVKCLMDLGQISTAASVIDGTVAKHNSWKNDFNSFRIEATWRLSRWDEVQSHLDHSPTAKLRQTSRVQDWNTRLGELLLVVKEKKWDKFKGLIDDIYLDQTGPLSAASMESGSYQRGYKSILRLHMLTELEFFTENLSSDEAMNLTEVANSTFSLWQARLQPLQSSFKLREPVLSLQRTMLDLLSITSREGGHGVEENDAVLRKLVGKLWLESAKQGRKAGYLQMTYNALINAQDLDLPEFCIEQSKWLWNKGESHQALLTLQKGVADHFPDSPSNTSQKSPQEKMLKGKAMLLVARLMEESSSFDSNTVLKQFRDVVGYMSEWEDSHFYAAKYYDKLMTAFMGDNRSSVKANHLYYIMLHYGQSLCYGTAHIYESLTKLLTVWLDYEANVAKLKKANKSYSKEDAKKLNKVITELREKLPAYIFLTAFSQLVSRICHPHLSTFEELKQVVAKVICAYPQQALWTMMAISKSSYSQRAQRCQEIFNFAEMKDRRLSKLLLDATRLTDKLLELCNKPTATVQSLSITTHFKPLKRLVEEESFSEILLPLQRFMTVTLPQGDTFQQQSAASMKEHEPFPGNAVHIVGFEDTVEVLASLQRPKKVSIRASDGKSYLFLCKPKDDLRKDARLMEFNTIVNKCLKLDSETRKRQLKIRTYAVVPLNEECGLIEWVPNTQGLRQILLAIYKARNIYTSGKVLKSLQLPYAAPLEKKLDVFRNKLLPRHPAVFGEWFLSTFSDPTSWYNARLAYARSTAVMSMVGYILGLGDRHGENILFDSMTGEAVHVDFNCLFNKGLTLDVPEIVPFRLTHNMTDAMGPMRHEGFFRCACETVMRLLRQQREPLLSVLKTFIYDPLVEWSKRSRAIPTNESGEILNEKALSHVSDIDKRLKGIAAKNKGLPLSVEGHVHYLIQEATDEEKLCQMYIGWAPYM